VFSWTTPSGIAEHIFPGWIEKLRGSEWGNAVLNALDLYIAPKMIKGATKGVGGAVTRFNNPSAATWMKYQVAKNPAIRVGITSEERLGLPKHVRRELERPVPSAAYMEELHKWEDRVNNMEIARRKLSSP